MISLQCLKQLTCKKNRIKVSEVLDKANQLAGANNLAEATKIILEMIQYLGVCPSASEDYVKGLIENLKDCLNKMKDLSSYKQGGAQILTSMAYSHSKQRSAKADAPSEDSKNTSLYQTKAKKKMISKINQK